MKRWQLVLMVLPVLAGCQVAASSVISAISTTVSVVQFVQMVAPDLLKLLPCVAA